MANKDSFKGTTIWEAAKQEWTRHICNLLVPVIEEGFRNIYTNCEHATQQQQQQDDDESDNNVAVAGVITGFQQTLKNIPKWNQEIIDQEYDRIIKELSSDESQDVLDDLIKAAFTSHILILTSVNLSCEINKKVEMNIPSTKRFIHKIYIESARVFYRNPHLFATGFNDLRGEYRHHKNAARIETIICNSVDETIRKLMPIKTILKAYLNDPVNNEKNLSDNEVDLEAEDITRRVSPRSKKGLKDVLKTYIQTTNEVLLKDEATSSKLKSILKNPIIDPENIDNQNDIIEVDELSDNDDNDDNEDINIPYTPGNNRRNSLIKRRLSPYPTKQRVQQKKDDDDSEEANDYKIFEKEKNKRNDDYNDRSKRSDDYTDRSKRSDDYVDRSKRSDDYVDRSRRSEYNDDVKKYRDDDHYKISRKNEEDFGFDETWPNLKIEKNPKSRVKSIDFRLDDADDNDKPKISDKRVTYKGQSRTKK